MTAAGGLAILRISDKCCFLIFCTPLCASRTAGSAYSRSFITTSFRFSISFSCFASSACVAIENSCFRSASFWSVSNLFNISLASLSLIFKILSFSESIPCNLSTWITVSRNLSKPTVICRCESSSSLCLILNKSVNIWTRFKKSVGVLLYDNVDLWSGINRWIKAKVSTIASLKFLALLLDKNGAKVLGIT